MPLYRVVNTERRLQVFRPLEFSSHYQEKALEDWLEDNPQVLVADEPLLVIGRQINTPVGIIDLLALDSEGTPLIIELKRAPDQRGAIAQALEYAAWLAEQSSETIRQIAEAYLKRKKGESNLEQAWQNAFNSEAQTVILNQQYRIFIVIEGSNERITAVARYLRRAGVDITLLNYNYYRTTSDEELMQIEKLVSDESLPGEGNIRTSSPLPTEAELLDKWSANANQAYNIFKARMLENGLFIKLRRSQVSFQKQTGDGDIFVCGFHGKGQAFKVYLRTDSLQSRFDFQSVVKRIEEQINPIVRPTHTSTWFILTCPATAEKSLQVATVIIEEVANHL